MDGDLRFGMLNENLALNKLKTLIKDNTLRKTKNTYDIFDFTNSTEDTYIELKSRRCYSYTYPNTMVGLNKVSYANQRPNKKFIFAFKFNDGLFYINHENGETYDIKTGGREDRGSPELKNYCYIDSNKLTKIYN